VVFNAAENLYVPITGRFMRSAFTEASLADFVHTVIPLYPEEQSSITREKEYIKERK
jgi:hypothetical protein